MAKQHEIQPSKKSKGSAPKKHTGSKEDGYVPVNSLELKNLRGV